MRMANQDEQASVMEGGSLESNAAWFAQQNLGQFAGKWVCAVEGQLVAADQSLTEVMDALKKSGLKGTPFISLVPRGHVTV